MSAQQSYFKNLWCYPRFHILDHNLLKVDSLDVEEVYPLTDSCFAYKIQSKYGLFKLNTGFQTLPMFDSIKAITDKVVFGSINGRYYHLNGPPPNSTESFLQYQRIVNVLLLKTRTNWQLRKLVPFTGDLAPSSLSSANDFFVTPNGIVFKNSGLSGFFSFSGEEIISAVVDSILEVGPEMNYAKVKAGKTYYGLVAKTEKVLVEDTLDSFQIIPSGFKKVEGNKICYYEEQGVNCIQTDSVVFQNGLLLYYCNDTICVVNKKSVLGPFPKNRTFQKLLPDSIVLFSDGGYWEFYQPNGIQLSQSFYPFTSLALPNEGLFPAKQYGQKGFISIDGFKRISHRYDSVRHFFGARAAVQITTPDQKKKWGFINRKDSLIVQPYYDSVSNFCDGIAIVLKDKRWSIIDSSGTMLLKRPVDSIVHLFDGSYIIELNNKKGLVAFDGKTLLLPIYQEIQPTFNGRWLVQQENYFGLYDSDKGFILPTSYQSIKVRPNGLGYVVSKR